MAFFRRTLNSLLSLLQSCSMMSSKSPEGIEPISDSFASLLVPELNTNTDAFLTVYRQGIYRTSDAERVKVLTRFLVESITGNKGRTFAQHEYVSVNILNTVTDQKYLFVFERNASTTTNSMADLQVTTRKLSTSSSECTSRVVKSPSTLDSLGRVIKSGRKSTSKQPIETTPLVSLDNTHLHASTTTASGSSLSAFPSPSGSSSSLSLLPSPSSRLLRLHNYTSQISLHDRFTLNSVCMVNSSTSSLDCHAKDRVLGRGMIEHIGHVISQLKPHHNLSLFELGILADVIHHDVLMYSLLDNQCY